MATSRTRPIGPVHLNAPFRKPLLGTDIEAGRFEAPVAIETIEEKDAGETATLEGARAISEALDKASRPLFVCGPLNPDRRDSAAVAKLANALNVPLLAEATSQLRFGPRPSSLICIDRGDQLLPGAFKADQPLEPDLIIEFGETPTSSGYGQGLVGNPGIERFCVRSQRFQDPWRSARAVFVTPIARMCEAIAGQSQNRQISQSTQRRSYPTAWTDADTDASTAIEIREAKRGGFSGQQALAAITASLPVSSHLLIGNSLAVRWLEASPRARPTADLNIHCQRGASGIDGLIAGAAGIAASARAPTCVVLGDVSAAHDIGSLAVAAQQSSPLVICVLDNRGGQIFAELPYSSKLAPSTLERFFSTPPTLDFAASARAFGVNAISTGTPELLGVAVSESMSSPAATLIHVPIDCYSPPVLGYRGATNDGEIQ